MHSHPPLVFEPHHVHDRLSHEEVMAWMELGVHHPPGTQMKARPVEQPKPAIGLFDEVRKRLLLIVTDPEELRHHAQRASERLRSEHRPVTTDPDTAMLAMLYNQEVNRTLAA